MTLYSWMILDKYTRQPIPNVTIHFQTVAGAYYTVTTGETSPYTMEWGVQISNASLSKAGYKEFYLYPVNMGYNEVELEPLAPQYSNVTITATGNGTTEPQPGNYPGTYELGSTLYVTATPAQGWRLVTMRRNGLDWTSAEKGEFLNLQATENVEVVFAEGVTPPPDGGDLTGAYIAGGALALLALVGAGYWFYTHPLTLP